MITFGEVLHLETLPTVVADVDGEIAGALAHMERQGILHIVALATDPTWQRSGVGGYLVAEAELVARARRFGKVLVATTNDNLPSLYFYQRKGYRITQILPGSMTGVGGDGPATGFAGIPIRDEIHLLKEIV
jgi:ribosomal protein S18 acetylase RimI-like enzyme